MALFLSDCLTKAMESLNFSAHQLRSYVGLAFAGTLICLNSALLYRSDRPELLGVSGLFLLTFLYEQWEREGFSRWRSPNTDISPWAILAGMSIWAWLLYKAWGFGEDEAFLRCLPFLSLVCWGLCWRGWSGLQEMYRGLILFGFLLIPWELVYLAVDLSTFTAKLAHTFLAVLGFEGERQGTLIRLGTGAIEVYHGCSGLKLALQLLGFGLIYLVLYPQGWGRCLGVITGAIAIGFLLNGLRVAMMAVLVSLGDENAFEYWHLGTGSLIFSAIAVVVLGVWCWGIQQWQNP